jgi:hypothetical protein
MELTNTIVLLILIRLIYLGIEISHPVYSILFGNLIVALTSSLINIFAFPFMTKMKYSTLANGNNTIYLIFYYSCWCALSGLRYIYIIHNNWLHEKFPEAKQISIRACLGVLSIFFTCIFSILGPLLAFGWPGIKVFEMPTKSKLISLTLIFGTLTLLMGSSCIFYIMILRENGKIFTNKIFTIEEPNIDTSENSASMEKRALEMKSAIRSLKTNIVLCGTAVLILILISIGSDQIHMVIIILIKALLPMFATVLNFEKIQELMFCYCETLRNSIVTVKQRCPTLSPIATCGDSQF